LPNISVSNKKPSNHQIIKKALDRAITIITDASILKIEAKLKEDCLKLIILFIEFKLKNLNISNSLIILL